MNSKDLVLNCKDLVFYITTFLNDTSSFRLFNCNIYYNNMIKNDPHKYTIKREVSNDTRSGDLDNKKLLKYKIKIYNEKRNLSIEQLDIPKYIEELHLSKFNQLVDGLPNGLLLLKLGNDFNQSIDNLPHSLTKLDLMDCRYFNQSINHLPKSITHLSLGDSFNQSISIDNLPNGLLTLRLGHSFNQSVDKLPSSLKHLYIGDKFNQSVDYLPSSLEYFSIGFFFNKRLDYLPKNLRYLVVGQMFNQPLDNLPRNLRYFYSSLYMTYSIDKSRYPNLYHGHIKE